ncbi:MAG: serine/threonine-protein kinase, partial [Acidobacteriota bacterium]
MGPYRLEDRIGRGSMGQVFSAYDARLDRRVALKQIHDSAAQDPKSRRRLLREARAAAKLNHPTLVQIHDVLEQDGSDWIVMELVQGRTLRESLSRRLLPPERALAYAARLAEGLTAAHGHGIVHRDLKTDNILITRSGGLKILDFGLAKDLQPSDESTLSRAGQIVGTPRSMSPEQARGQRVDARTDLFALGVILYEMLTGISPFDAPTAAGSLDKVCRHHPPKPSTQGRVPPRVDDLVMRLLAKNPGDRPASAAEVRRELGALLAAWPGLEDASLSHLVKLSPQPATRASGQAGSTRWTSAPARTAVAALLCAGIVAGLAFLWNPRSAREAPPPQGAGAAGSAGAAPVYQTPVPVQFEGLSHQGDPEYSHFTTRLTKLLRDQLRSMEGRVRASSQPDVEAAPAEASGRDERDSGGEPLLLAGEVTWLEGLTPQKGRWNAVIHVEVLDPEALTNVWSDRFIEQFD